MKNYDLSASCNTIEKNSSFTGNFISESDFRVDGSFEGNIETKGKVVIGKNGNIDGTIVCVSADIEGKFKGTIHVEDLLSIKSSGEVQGDVEAAPRLRQGHARQEGREGADLEAPRQVARRRALGRLRLDRADGEGDEVAGLR